MRRRGLLRAAAVTGAGLLAGCTDDGGGAAPASPTGSPTATPTEPEPTTEQTPTRDTSTEPTPTDEPTPTEPTTESTPTESTPTEEPTSTETSTSGSRELTDRSFEVVDSSCGEGANRAVVERSTDRVDVDGVIDGRNGCYTAELDRAVYDDEADELTVDVRAFEEGDGACMQCIVDVDYRATFRFDRGTPDTVTVRHDGEQVTSA